MADDHSNNSNSVNTSETIDKMTVSQLKTFLKRRDVSTSDYRREMLVGLAKLAEEIQLEKNQEFCEEMFSTESRRTVTIDGKSVVFEDPEHIREWDTDLKLLPDIELSHCFHYLHTVCGWNASRLANYTKDNGYKLFSDRHISSVKMTSLNHDHVYVKADCVRQTSINEAPYKVFILMERSGVVISAGCHCVAGDGSCKHVAALLFSLHDFVLRHEDRNTEVCTDMPCTWTVPRKRSRPEQWDNIDIRGDSETPSKKSTCDYYTPFPPLSPSKTNEVKNDFLNLIQGTDSCLAIDYDESDSESDSEKPKSLIEIVSSMNKPRCADSIMTTLRDQTSNDIISEIFDLTTDQSDSSDWYRYREGRITASIAKKVAHATEKTLMNEDNYITNSIMAKSSIDFKVDSLEFGKSHEITARHLYIQAEMKKHSRFSVQDSGLVVSNLYPHLGASPDGIVNCDCCGKGVLEIKCSYKYANEKLETVLPSATNYECTYQENALSLKTSSPWFYQIQMQMAIVDVEWCDFVLYTTKGILVSRIKRDQGFWQKLVNKLNSFYDRCIMPKLINF